MTNQDASNRVDKTGGDATSATVLPTPEVDKTAWDIFNNKDASSGEAAMGTEPEGDED